MSKIIEIYQNWHNSPGRKFFLLSFFLAFVLLFCDAIFTYQSRLGEISTEKFLLCCRKSQAEWNVVNVEIFLNLIPKKFFESLRLMFLLRFAFLWKFKYSRGRLLCKEDDRTHFIVSSTLCGKREERNLCRTLAVSAFKSTSWLWGICLHFWVFSI